MVYTFFFTNKIIKLKQIWALWGGKVSIYYISIFNSTQEKIYQVICGKYR